MQDKCELDHWIGYCIFGGLSHSQRWRVKCEGLYMLYMYKREFATLRSSNLNFSKASIKYINLPNECHFRLARLNSEEDMRHKRTSSEIVLLAGLTVTNPAHETKRYPTVIINIDTRYEVGEEKRNPQIFGVARDPSTTVNTRSGGIKNRIKWSSDKAKQKTFRDISMTKGRAGEGYYRRE